MKRMGKFQFYFKINSMDLNGLKGILIMIVIVNQRSIILCVKLLFEKYIEKLNVNSHVSNNAACELKNMNEKIGIIQVCTHNENIHLQKRSSAD